MLVTVPGMHAWRPLQPRRDDRGFSMVEMLVGFVILAVVLSALAVMMVTSLRATQESQERVGATGIANERMEGLQAVPWHLAGIHEDDPDRVDEYDGRETVVLPSGSPPDERTPAALDTEVREGTEYEVRTHVTWTTLEEGAPDAKRFDVVVSWDPAQGPPREVAVTGHRVPDDAELSGVGEDGTRALQISASPNPCELDGDDGTAVDDLVVRTQLTRDDVLVQLRAQVPDDDGDPEELSAPMSPASGTGAFDLVIPAGTQALYNDRTDLQVVVDGGVVGVQTLECSGGPFDIDGDAAPDPDDPDDPDDPEDPEDPEEPPDPPSDVEALAGVESALVTWAAPGGQVESYTVASVDGSAVTTVDGDESEATLEGLTPGESYAFTVTATNEAGDSDPGGPSDPVEPTEELPEVTIDNVLPPATVCVNTSNGRLSSDLVVEAMVSGLGDGDTVDVTYPHWSNPGQGPPGEPDRVSTDAAARVGDTDLYRLTVPAGTNTRLFEHRGGSSVTFTIDAQRSVDDATDQRVTAPVSVSEC